MATVYGLTATGFAIKTLDQILLELQQAFQAAFGAGIDVSGNSILGQLIGILAGREADLWELAQAVFQAAFPDTAQGVDLSYAVTLTGQQRLGAAFSTVQAYFSGPANSNITISAGTQVGVALAPPPDPGSQIASGVVFQTTADVTLDQWGHASTTMVATATGPLAAPMGTLILPVTPLPAGVTVTNPTDAALGRDDESDAQLRSRRARQLVTAVGGTQTAIQEALLKVAGVYFAAATENSGDAVDASGVPPHSLHVFVLGGLDSDVAQAIWNAKPAGANSYGANSATILDTYGNQQTISWDRGQDVPIYLVVQRTTNAAYPADGDQQIVDALLAYGATLSSGDTVFNWRLAAALSSIPGIDTLQILQGTAPNPTSSANTPIAGNQIATFASQNIVVEMATSSSTSTTTTSTSSSSSTSSTTSSSSTTSTTSSSSSTSSTSSTTSTTASSATLTASVSGTTVTLAWSGVDVTTQIQGSDGAMYTPNYVRVGLSNGYYSLLPTASAGSTSFQTLPAASYTATIESYYQSTSMMTAPVTGAGPVQASANFTIA